jgi:hypothetical protein
MKGRLLVIAAIIGAAVAAQAVQAQENMLLSFTSSGFEGKALSVPDITGVLPAVNEPAVEPVSIPVGNFGVVLSQGGGARGNIRDGVVYRGGSLDNDAAYAFLRNLGVSAVVNLQSFHPSDTALCSRYGLNCQELGILPFDYISLTKNSAFQKAFRFVLEEGKAGRKVYIHCMKGKDRTGALAAALVIREQACGGTLDKARLRDTIEASLNAHNFWFRNYPKWHAEIIDWVENFEANRDWLCN